MQKVLQCLHAVSRWAEVHTLSRWQTVVAFSSRQQWQTALPFHSAIADGLLDGFLEAMGVQALLAAHLPLKHLQRQENCGVSCVLIRIAFACLCASWHTCSSPQ